jgi:hypothetical protein
MDLITVIIVETVALIVAVALLVSLGGIMRRNDDLCQKVFRQYLDVQDEITWLRMDRDEYKKKWEELHDMAFPSINNRNDNDD